MFYEVLVSKLFKKSPKFEDGILTYSFDQNLAPGTIVEVPIGKTKAAGVIYRKVKNQDFKFKLKSITGVIYDQPLPDHAIKAILWLSKYYLVPIPQVVSLFLPNGISKKRRARAEKSENLSVNLTDIKLNTAQKEAIKALDEIQTNTKLLHGITGSGKTNIYLTLAKREFDASRSTILLVPEIALTSQLVQVFKQVFNDNVVLIHSAMTEAERHLTWEKILKSTTPQIVVGPRSALFSPLKDLGLIIIDEAHEPAYFQEQPPKYSALRLGSFIAKTKNITCLQGTATPLISDYYLANENHACVELKEKAIKTNSKTDIKIVDFKDRSNFTTNRYFSDELLKSIKENLKNHHQTLIFHNRRGSAPLTICEHCGWQALCPNCFLPMTLHSDNFTLVCHTCGHTEKVPTSCPECQHTNIIHKGFGTKLLEAELHKIFKDARIARFDSDNNRDETLNAHYDDVKNGKVDIIIGTQTIARGLDLQNLATVGVVQADAGLSLPDYSAEERTFHLLTQVLGRVGRGHLEHDNAIIQTYQPDHPAITAALSADYDSFYQSLIKKRKKAHLPPYEFIALLYLTYKTESIVLKKIKTVATSLKNQDGVTVSTPMPAFHERTQNGYTWQIVLKSSSRAKLVSAIESLPNYSEFHFVIDPPSLI